MFSEVILYLPHSKELKLEEAVQLYEEKVSGERKIQIVKKQVMEFLDDVTEARFFVEEVMKEIDVDQTGFEMDPTLAQENLECENEQMLEHPDYGHINPDIVDVNDEIPIKSIYKKVEIQSIDILKRKTRSLDDFQRHVINKAVKFAKDVVKSRNGFNKLPISPLLMVHGGAGAGKSTVIDVLAQWVELILQKEGDDLNSPCVIKCAPTGAAAANIEGQTLHSSFNFSYDGKCYSLNDKARDQRREILKNLKMVSIFSELDFRHLIKKFLLSKKSFLSKIDKYHFFHKRLLFY